MKNKLIIALFTTFAGLVPASAATVNIQGSYVYQGGNFISFFFDTSSLAGQQLEGSQFVTSAQLPSGTIFTLFAGATMFDDGYSAYDTVLGSQNILAATTLSGTPTGNWLIEPFQGRELLYPFLFTDPGTPTTSLDWQNRNLGQNWELTLILNNPQVIESLDSGGIIFTANVIPEPSSVLLLGLSGLAAFIRRRR